MYVACTAYTWTYVNNNVFPSQALIEIWFQIHYWIHWLTLMISQYRCRQCFISSSVPDTMTMMGASPNFLLRHTYIYHKLMLTATPEGQDWKGMPSYLHLFTEASIEYRLTFWSATLSVPLFCVKHSNTCFLCSFNWSLNCPENLIWIS